MSYAVRIYLQTDNKTVQIFQAELLPETPEYVPRVTTV